MANREMGDIPGLKDAPRLVNIEKLVDGPSHVIPATSMPMSCSLFRQWSTRFDFSSPVWKFIKTPKNP